MVILALGLRTARAISTMPTAVFLWRGARLGVASPFRDSPGQRYPDSSTARGAPSGRAVFRMTHAGKSSNSSERRIHQDSIDMLAAQAVISAQSPRFISRTPVNPGQHCISGHFADHARSMPIIGQARIGSMAVGQQHGAGLYVGPQENSSEAAELSAIIARRIRPERVSRYFACFVAPGLIRVAIDHLDGPQTWILPALPASKNVSPSRKGTYLDRLQRPLREVLGIGRPRSPQLSASNQALR